MAIERKHYINARQIKAARSLVDWSQEDLAEATDLSIATIRKIESGQISPRGNSLDAIFYAFETQRLEFLPPMGVRLRDNDLITLEGNDSYLQLLDDVDQTLRGKTAEVLMLYANSSKANELENQATRRLKQQGLAWRFICEEGNTFLHYPLEEYRWLPKKYFKRNPHLIYANKVAMSCLVDTTDETTKKIVIIESASLAEATRNLFNFMWDNCAKPTHSTAPVIYT